MWRSLSHELSVAESRDWPCVCYMPIKRYSFSIQYFDFQAACIQVNCITVVYCVGFEVFTAVVLKSIFFCDMTPCSALSGTRRFGGTYRLHLQGRRIVQQSSEQASGKRYHSTHYTASYPRRRYSSVVYCVHIHVL
jgi:hypothetical protein